MNYYEDYKACNYSLQTYIESRDWLLEYTREYKGVVPVGEDKLRVKALNRLIIELEASCVTQNKVAIE